MWAYSLKTLNTCYSFHDVTYFQSNFLIFCTLFWNTFPVHNLYCCWFNGVGSHWRGIFMVFKTYSTSWAPYSCPRTAPSRDAKCLKFKFCLQTFMPPGQLLTDPVLPAVSWWACKIWPNQFNKVSERVKLALINHIFSKLARMP